MIFFLSVGAGVVTVSRQEVADCDWKDCVKSVNVIVGGLLGGEDFGWMETCHKLCLEECFCDVTL